MESLIRGFIDSNEGQVSYYFENTDRNIANFIYLNITDDNEITINNIFGDMISSYRKKDGIIKGKLVDTQGVTIYLENLMNGTTAPEEVEYLDLSNIDERDEFERFSLENNQYEKYL